MMVSRSLSRVVGFPPQIICVSLSSNLMTVSSLTRFRVRAPPVRSSLMLEKPSCASFFITASTSMLPYSYLTFFSTSSFVGALLLEMVSSLTLSAHGWMQWTLSLTCKTPVNVEKVTPAATSFGDIFWASSEVM